MARRPENDQEPDILDILPEEPGKGAASGPDWLGRRLRLGLTILLGLTAVGATVITVWYIVAGGSGEQPVPIIAADPGPVKVRPEDPGGMDIPHQEMTVYDRLSGAGTVAAERVLPPPEEPVAPPPPAEPAPAAPEVAVEPLPDLPPGTEPAPPTTLTERAAPETRVPQEPSPPTEPAPPPAQAEPAPPPPAAPKPAVAAAPPGGDFQVQLAAMRSADKARQAWTQLQKAHGDLLGGLKSQIIKADLGEKGIFYRLRAGPLSEAAAKKLCDALKQRKQGCLVARR